MTDPKVNPTPSSSEAEKIVARGERPAGDGETTTLGGVPVASENISVTQGRQGANVMTDIHLIEKLAHFNRENVPERIPHAKGHGAFGELHITEDVSKYTKAKLFQKGTVTPMAARFSAVAGESGAPDTWRDVHGFALRFYTEDGNYDIVGNNTPVFFLRDAMKFPDFIHSQKRDPASGLRSDEMQWDFWSRTPETLHQVTYLLGDRGTPKTSRHQDGFGSHTFQWINEEGDAVWVKYHFKTRQGWECFTDAEATEKAGTDPDFHREDLFKSIERGDYPIWDVKVQIMPFEDAENYKYNPFDLTKVWSQKDYPLVDVGYFVLNRNPKNFHAQIEQIALDPSNLVPGVGLSPDRMLQARIFAYADQHRYRIGPNYNDLPVNQPVTPVNTYAERGPMAYFYNHEGEPNYSPNRTDKGMGYLDNGEDSSSMQDYGQADNLYVNPDPHGTDLVRAAYVKHELDDDASQPRELYERVFDDAAKKRFIDNITNKMLAIENKDVEERTFKYWGMISDDLEQKLRSELAKKRQEAAEGDKDKADKSNSTANP